jgi:hypothetical protein
MIWDHTAGILTWMNAAARSKFQLSTAELHRKLATPLARCFAAAAKQGKASGAVKLKVQPGTAISCSFEILGLAGGHDGLIVAEAAAAVQAPPDTARQELAPKKSPRPKAGSANKRRPAVKPCNGRQSAPVPSQMPGSQAPAAAQLTPDEMRAFKAVGRTVRRLAKERRRSTDTASAAASMPPVPPKRAVADVQAMQALLFSAFDLVLFLSEDLAVSQTEGRPQIVGWRKSLLLGQPAGKVLLPPEQTVLHRMLKKLRAGARMCRDTLVLTGEAEDSVPCRAVLGRCPDGRASYFLALLSLELPARLKRQTALPLIARLAA